MIDQEVLRKIVLEDLDSAINEGYKELLTMTDEEVANDMIAYDSNLNTFNLEAIPTVADLVPHIKFWRSTKEIAVDK